MNMRNFDIIGIALFTLNVMFAAVNFTVGNVVVGSLNAVVAIFLGVLVYAKE